MNIETAAILLLSARGLMKEYTEECGTFVSFSIISAFNWDRSGRGREAWERLYNESISLAARFMNARQ